AATEWSPGVSCYFFIWTYEPSADAPSYEWATTNQRCDRSAFTIPQRTITIRLPRQSTIAPSKWNHFSANAQYAYLPYANGADGTRAESNVGRTSQERN